MVERVERFRTKLDRFSLCDAQALLQGQVKVLDSGAVEVSALCVAELTENLLGEERRVERRTTIATIPIDLEWSGNIAGRIQQVVICAIA